MSSINSFGRLVAPKDGRDHLHLMRSARTQLPTKKRTKPYPLGPLLNQRETPHCCGFGMRGQIEAAPLMTQPKWPPTPKQLYDLAQLNDEWPGTDYDGTSVRGVCKAAQLVGLINGYAWGQTAEEAADWILNDLGTLLIGIDWFAEMSSVDNRGFMREPAPSLSTPIGGHCIHVVWFDTKLDCFVVRNSWGNEFGWPDPKTGELTGYARMRREFLTWLQARDGEIAAPVQVRLTPVMP